MGAVWANIDCRVPLWCIYDDTVAYMPYCSTTVTMIRYEALGFLPEPIDHSGQAMGGAMVFSFTTQVDAV